MSIQLLCVEMSYITVSVSLREHPNVYSAQMYSLFLVGITLIALILCNLTVSINVLIPYSGLFSWGEILVKSWKRLSGIKFRGFNFCGAIAWHNVNFELGTHGENFAVDKKSFSVKSCVRGYSLGILCQHSENKPGKVLPAIDCRHILTPFIAHLNLDLAIQTRFGMH